MLKRYTYFYTVCNLLLRYVDDAYGNACVVGQCMIWYIL
jgi:hypothetical protein